MAVPDEEREVVAGHVGGLPRQQQDAVGRRRPGEVEQRGSKSGKDIFGKVVLYKAICFWTFSAFPHISISVYQ